jgi:hypothetical protein
MVVDRESSLLIFRRFDGKYTQFPSPLYFDTTSAISRMQYAPQLHRISITTIHGDEFVAEVATLNDEEPRDGRPIVYLDQRDWSTLAKSLDPKAKLSAKNRAAGSRLIALARNRRVILPLSSAHMSETGKWTDRQARYRHALLLSELSAGWQMRDPLTLRRQELAMAFARRFNPMLIQALPPFTLAPYAVFDPKELGEMLSTSDLPADYAYAAEALTSLMVNFDVLLDAEHVPMPTSPGWVQKNQGFTEWLASEKTGRELTRSRTNLYFIADARGEIAQAATQARISADQLHEWLITTADDDISAMPCLGLFREALHDKHVNSTSTWDPNDLTDTIYLTCAAGYADHVVCEKHWAGLIGQGIRRLGRPVHIWSSLAQLVDALEAEVD